MQKTTRDKIIGTFLGIAIGDAIGKALETYSASHIAEKYGRVTDYVSCSDHKWFSGDLPGTTTDDYQLSAAIARSFRDTGKFDLDRIAAEHVKEFKSCVLGWGASTKEAVARLATGVSYIESGKTEKPHRGTGNGVCMKVAPIACYMAATNPGCNKKQWDQDVAKLIQVATMTHYTSMAVTSGLAQTFAVFKCLLSIPATFDLQSFINSVAGAGMMGRRCLPHTITEDDLQNRLNLLYNHEEFGVQCIVDELKGGCYVYESLPFTLMFFVKNPFSVESLYEVVSAGGDTDTNASMLGALLGALNGPGIFPQHLVDGLKEKEAILKLANEFCDRFFGGVKP